MIGRLLSRLFHGPDQSRVDAAMSRWEATTHRMALQARALRRDIHCGDPIAFAQMLTAAATSNWKLVLRHVGLTVPDQHTPPDMLAMLAELDRKERR